jgi:hypothetical protein
LRASFIIVVAAFTSIVSAAETIRIDGIPVYGRIHDVTRADIRAAVADFGGKPASIEVISKTEMRLYLQNRDLGWIPKCPIQVVETDGRRHAGWGWCGRLGLEDDPEALRLIRSADQVYIFPVTFTNKATDSVTFSATPHRDHKHLRLLEREASRPLARLLGNSKNWLHGFDDTIWIGPVPSNVGFIFRKGKDELVLFCTVGWRVEGTLNGQHTGGSLEEKPEQKLEDWKKRYAQPELTIKRPNQAMQPTARRRTASVLND